MAKEEKTIEIALQGGGAHGALTWGVLDRLLEEPFLRIEGVSGTSAGAMNAAVLADGLEVGGKKGARDALERFWKEVSGAALTSPFQRDIWSRLTGSWSLDKSPVFLFFEQISQFLSPYELNPLNLNPLRDLVGSLVDFDRVNRCSAIRVFVTATNVRTGRPKVFRQPEISVDVLMASAALPLVFQAVEINGEAYWDGGYTGNPALFPLVDECDARDLLLIQINPFYRPEIPRTARDVINRLNEITFNTSLLKEIRTILLLRDLIDAEGLDHERYRNMRLHRIHGDEDLLDLTASSKMNAEWSYLCHLRDKGRQRTDAWLSRHWDDLGARSTFDVEWLMEDSVRRTTTNQKRCPTPATETDDSVK